MDISFITINSDSTIEAFYDMLPELKGGSLIGAVDSEMMPCGVCEFFIHGDELEISYLFVPYERRKQGIGTALIMNLLKKTQKNMDFYDIVINFDSALNDGDFLDFIHSFSFFDINVSSEVYKISPGDWHKSPLLKKKPQERVIEFAAVPKNIQKNLFYKLGETTGRFFVNDSYENIFIKEFSLCIMDNKTIKDVILVQKYGESDLEVSWLFSNNSNNTDLLCLLVTALHRAKKYAPNANIYVNAINPKIIILLKRVFGRMEKVSNMIEARWNYTDDINVAEVE